MAFTPNRGGYRPKPQGSRPKPARRPNGPVEKEAEHRVNEHIRGVSEVRLVGDNVEPGIYDLRRALQMAEDQELDLVEIAAGAVPPVCRIIDYQKFCYQQKKKAKEIKAKAAKVVIKEIRFGPQTDDHDYEFKLRHAREFLGEGAKVKSYVFFKGRSILFKEQGEVLLLRFASDLEDVGRVESMPVLEGKRMIMMIAPKSQPRKGETPKGTKPAGDDAAAADQADEA